MRYDTIKEISRFDTIQEVEKFNPYHGADGRFTSAGVATSFTYAPGKSKAHDLAIAREKERMDGTARLGNAEKAMKDLLNKGSVVSLQGVDAELAEEAVSSVRKVFERYPIAKNAITGISAEDETSWVFKDNPKGMAACDISSGRIYLNRKYYKNKAELEQAYEDSVQKKFHPENTKTNSIIVHEIGHAMDVYVSEKAIGSQTYWNNDRISNRKWNNDITAAERAGTPLTGGTIRDSLSLYAAHNHAEYFAEGFAEGMMSPSPRKRATGIMKHLDSYVKKAEAKMQEGRT